METKTLQKSVLPGEPLSPKSLHNTTTSHAQKNVVDLKFWGIPDKFRLLAKASSEREGWMKSTKAMEIAHVGCVVQVTTQQRNGDGTYALSEALTFVPGVRIEENRNGNDVVDRMLVPFRA